MEPSISLRENAPGIGQLSETHHSRLGVCMHAYFRYSSPVSVDDHLIAATVAGAGNIDVDYAC